MVDQTEKTQRLFTTTTAVIRARECRLDETRLTELEQYGAHVTEAYARVHVTSAGYSLCSGAQARAAAEAQRGRGGSCLQLACVRHMAVHGAGKPRSFT